MEEYNYTIEEVEDILEELAMELPEEFFLKLHGGISLIDQIKYHPEAVGNDLYILGEYQRGVYGNMIRIYYGSFMKTYGFLPRELLKDKLRKTLRHEFRHHLEHLSGERDLEIEDEIALEKYKKRFENRKSRDQ